MRTDRRFGSAVFQISTSARRSDMAGSRWQVGSLIWKVDGRASSSWDQLGATRNLQVSHSHFPTHSPDQLIAGSGLRRNGRGAASERDATGVRWRSRRVRGRRGMRLSAAAPARELGHVQPQAHMVAERGSPLVCEGFSPKARPFMATGTGRVIVRRTAPGVEG
jgi:hypothetical protein